MDVAAIQDLLRQQDIPRGPLPGWEQELLDVAAGEVRLRESLKRYTTLQVGGPADALVFPADREDLRRILKFAQEYQVPTWVLGWGSNVIVKDGGIRGIVFRLTKTLKNFKIVEESDQRCVVEAEAGYSLPKLVELGKEKGFAGIASLYGIPASVGGALWMNAGTKQGEIQSFVESVTMLLEDGSEVTYPRKRLKFEYRHFKAPERGIIVAARLAFPKADPEEVKAQIQAYQKRRHETQPLHLPNFGSVFKNPPKNYAAAIIEDLGLKGVRVGGARVSEKHANFIVNERGATAKDVLAIIGLIRDKVKEESELKLELEAKIVGEDG